MYRALTWLALERDLDLEDGTALAELARDHPMSVRGRPWSVGGGDISSEIRTVEIDRVVSTVARHPQVRAIMRERQRELASDGRRRHRGA